jgi:hypothetical protein
VVVVVIHNVLIRLVKVIVLDVLEDAEISALLITALLRVQSLVVPPAIKDVL